MSSIRSAAWLAALMAAAAVVFPPRAGEPAFQPHVFVTTRQAGITGNTAAVEIAPPWDSQVDLEPVGEDTVVRHFLGKHYVVDRSGGQIQVIDPGSFDTVARYGVGAVPQDIAVIDARSAWVSRRDSSLLLQIDPASGAVLGSVDLSSLADADGLPEMAMMARDGSRLFVQIQRLDRTNGWAPVPPSYLAVVDTAAGRLEQAIELTGTIPSFKMHVEPERRRLYVSEPGLVFEPEAGGIEAIDLDSLEALGFVTTEPQLNSLDLGPFVMVSPEKGFALTYTDFAALTHLTPFSRVDGAGSPSVHDSSGTHHALAWDPATDLVFVLDATGVHVVDAVTETRLTREPAETGLPPADLVVARPQTPGEATGLLVAGFTPGPPTAGATGATGAGAGPAAGTLAIRYEPGCAAADHNLVFGPLAEVGTHGYTGQVCGIGTSGSYDRFSPGLDSAFFLVVATDAEAVEGSYGTASDGTERPEDRFDPACSFRQDLDLRCD